MQICCGLSRQILRSFIVVFFLGREDLNYAIITDNKSVLVLTEKVCLFLTTNSVI